MPNSNEKNGPIKVSGISIAQLSRGLYRSNAAAFKELVSNAWDVDARNVWISTNFPEFDFISCTDDGPGMSLDDFLKYFSEKGIGYCFKRRGNRDTTDTYKRPIIGRLGVGMLAIGQLCHSFQIESHYIDEDGEGKAYLGEIVLLDDAIRDLDDTIRREGTEREDIEVGRWSYNDDIPYDESRRGFRIFSSDVRETFRDEMKQGVEQLRDRLPFELKRLHLEYYSKAARSIRELGSYLRTIWELCILCPLPYYGELPKYPIDITALTEDAMTDEYAQALTMISERQSSLNNWQFDVTFDGVQLYRYLQLPQGKGIPRVFYTSFNDTIADRPLSFSGYIYAQTEAVRPLELSGIQIRLRGVGIGGYDSTFLNYYERIETIRNRWVSGEIFIDDGLESALNLDRDSFNEHDEHYKALQSHLHKKLDTVFGEIERVAERKRRASRDQRDKGLSDTLQDINEEETKGNLEIIYSDMGTASPLVSVDMNNKQIMLNTSLILSRRKKPRMMIRQIALAYHIAKNLTDTEESRYEVFYRMLQKIAEGLV